ncbi:ArdC family protein [Sungkyunkwania multivorans]|uniref:ArdC family protein n=1 Tax=Sungkyunkwania multivorans TaxID=1173618 RepID=A0ABW3D086_9FLAO
MKCIERYNALNGRRTKREELVEIEKVARSEEQLHVSKKLAGLLAAYPKARHFKLDVGHQEEVVPVSMLGTLFHEDQRPYRGMGKPVTPSEIYKYVTDLMVNTIKKVGNLPWQREWERTTLYNGLQAVNYESKKGYRGINYFLLNFEVKSIDGEHILAPKVWKNPFFLTFNQIKKFKGKLKKGSNGHRVVYFTRLYTHTEADNNQISFSSYSKVKFKNWVLKNKDNINILQNTAWTVDRFVDGSFIPILKYYNVFNGGDVIGIDFGEVPKNDNVERPIRERIEIGERIVGAMPNAPKIIFKGDQPSYRPSTDTVMMTPIDAFNNEQAYYSTLFHELVHSTGHHKRLDRDLTGSRGNQAYAFEELIAELGGVFLCSESGILFSTIENSAKYLKGWSKRLVNSMEKDDKFFFRVASKAQAAADHILDRNKDGLPSYRMGIQEPKAKTSKSEKNKGRSKAKDMASPRRKGIAKIGLSASGKLKKGFMYLKGGKIVKVENDKNNRKTVIVLDEEHVPKPTTNMKNGKQGRPLPSELVVEEQRPAPVSNEVIVPVKEALTVAGNDLTEGASDHPINRKVITDPKISKLGFIAASKAPRRANGIFMLPGEIGQFLQQLQPHKALILIKGDKHSSKSQLAMQIANAFGEMNQPVGYIDYEQGGIHSKDTQNSLKWNTTAKGRGNIAIKGEVEDPLKEIEEMCKYFKVIVADSATDLGLTADELSYLRNKYPSVIWVFIIQVKENGKMYGGNKMAHNPTVIIHCYTSTHPQDRYASLEKNRGNDLNRFYNMFHKRLIPDPGLGEELPNEILM